MTTLYTEMASPLGTLLLTAQDGALTGVHFPGQKHDRPRQPDWQRADDDPVLAQARAELGEYFAGRRTRFDVRLDPRGTPFQRAVWQALLAVPFGATSTYGAIAQAVRRPSAVRAVGAAVGANPIGIVVPCHRIIGHDGTLTGYAGGLDRKAKLLEFEDRAAKLELTPQAHPR
jgi:methylated-DNA-[protein]-cysteine S-methyltransferase